MHNVIPFPKEEPAAPRPERLDLFDDIDKSTGNPIFGVFVRRADGSWVDGEFYDSRAERDAAIPSWKADWGVDVVEVFWERQPS